MIDKGAAYMKTLNTMQIVPMTKVRLLWVCSKVNDKLATAAKNTNIIASNTTTLICVNRMKKVEVRP
jgi:hypothetical protein